ncbi:MAG TPA: gluconokinase [Polyangiales bacterium]|nr:gluconokinase [Polyangiales bacterium]
MQIVVMGVSGSGKSVVGEALAARLGVPFVDGDSLHSAENVAKMASGTALTDVDRAPWLDAVGAWLAAHQGVVACSALRRTYRDRLRAFAPAARFVQLNVDPQLLKARLDTRQHHFMPSTLLRSQLAIFEPLGTDENGVAVDNTGGTPEEVAARIPV